MIEKVLTEYRQGVGLVLWLQSRIWHFLSQILFPFLGVLEDCLGEEEILVLVAGVLGVEEMVALTVVLDSVLFVSLVV